MSLPVLHSVDDVLAMLPAPRPSLKWLKAVARKSGNCRVLGRGFAFTEQDARAMVAIYAKAKKNFGQQDASGYVYFAKCLDRVKIGVAKNPATRLKQFQTACPYPVEIVWTCKGGYPKEREFHERFSTLHVNGEWFRLEEGLADFINEKRSP
jgi:hypothetical protein